MRHSLAMGVAFAAVGLAGCVGGLGDLALATTDGAWRVKKGLPPPPLEAETVVVQHLRIDRPEADPALLDRLWRAGDDGFLDAEHKAELARHGLRAARLPDPPPPELLALLDDQGPNGYSAQMLAGKPFRMEMTALLAERQWFRCKDGALCGETLRNAQGYLVATPALAGDRRVRLTVEPRLEFGQPQPHAFAGATGLGLASAPLHGLDVRHERNAREFPELRMQAELASGEHLIVGPLPGAGASVGDLLFRKPEASPPTAGVMVFRVIRPTAEDLFVAGSGAPARLRTPAGATVRGE